MGIKPPINYNTMLKKTWKSTGNPAFEAALTAMSNHMILRNNANATRVNYLCGVRDLMVTLDKLLVGGFVFYMVFSQDS